MDILQTNLDYDHAMEESKILLPIEIIQSIALFLPTNDIGNCTGVSKHYHKALNQKIFWKSKYLLDFGKYVDDTKTKKG